ncbi:MAG: ABC transporter ATP-binding protein [Fimbriiglobus sp.]
MIEVEGLTKLFHKPDGTEAPAVDDLNFAVRPGEVFGLLGPNGAGKTTTLRMLCTLLKPSQGFASVAGHDIVAEPALVRANIGFVSANTGVYDRMTAWEMVEYYGKLYGMSGDALRLRLENLFGKFQMHDFRNVPGGQLSTGMKQKVSIARAMIHDPPVLIFDEPTAGLDILVQRAVMQSIQELRAQGKTILFSTHIMREVEKLCDRVAIMAKGRIVAMGSLDELRDTHNEPDLEELFFSLVS